MATRSKECHRRAAFLRLGATAVVGLGLVGLAGLLSSCRCEAKPEPVSQPLDNPELSLLEPLSNAPAEAETCSQMALPEQLLRATSLHDAAASSIEVESGVLSKSGYALFSYRSNQETQWLVAVGTDRDTLVEIPLGRAIGMVDAPVGIIHNGALLILLQHNEAMGQKMQLVRIDSPFHEPKVTRGPSVSIGRDESPFASLAVASGGMGLLVWDEFDRAADRSRVMGLGFDPMTLKELNAPRILSLTDEDAEQPKLLPQGEGFSLNYLHLTIEPAAANDEALVVEPKRSLQSRLLDGLGRPSSESTRVSEEFEHVLAFDAAEIRSGWLLAYRSTRAGNTVESSGISLAQVRLDGTVIRGRAEHAQLGPGAPVLLGHPSKNPWLLARGSDAELLKAEVSDVADVRLHAESALVETIPMARFEERLLAIKPVGLDWSVVHFDCSERAR